MLLSTTKPARCRTDFKYWFSYCFYTDWPEAKFIFALGIISGVDQSITSARLARFATIRSVLGDPSLIRVLSKYFSLEKGVGYLRILDKMTHWLPSTIYRTWSLPPRPNRKTRRKDRRNDETRNTHTMVSPPPSWITGNVPVVCCLSMGADPLLTFRFQWAVGYMGTGFASRHVDRKALDSRYPI